MKIFLWILLWITIFVMLGMHLTKVVVEPWIREKILASVNEKFGDYQLKLERVHVSILRSGIEFKHITLQSKQENEGRPDFRGEIESVKFKGIHFIKAVFRKDVVIKEVEISNSCIIGEFTFPEKEGFARMSPLSIWIKRLIINNMDVDVKSTTTAKSYFLKDGVLKVYDIHVEKQDTLSPGIIGHFDFNAAKIKTVIPDSLYTFLIVGINYSAMTNTLTADSFAMQPNYTEYEFTARHPFETDRIEGSFRQVSFHDFSAADFVKSGDLTSSYIEIGEMKLNVFRDKRKEFRHIEKPTFQKMIYTYPGVLNIDSIGILSGNIVYSEHAEQAVEKGSISLNDIDATIYKITNDTMYKTEEAYLELKMNSLLMGKGKATIFLKARIFDSQNTFAMSGTLSDMEASDLNPFLENNAFLTIRKGRINAMNFSFSANNTKANGHLELLYQGLNVAILNKTTGESRAIIERVKTLIANIALMESNPSPGKDVRTGIIEYERDPERFLFSYFVRSLASGIKTSIIKQ